MTDPAIPEPVKWQRDDFSNIDEPFADDHWGRKQFAEHLTGYVQRMKVGATIAIDAEWGAGKTWFVQHWKRHLIKGGHAVAYIDAFANDYIDDPFLLIATEIANQVEKQEAGAGRSLKDKAVSVYHAMLPSLPKLIFSAAMTLMGAGLLAQSVTETIGSIKETTGDFGEKFAEEINERMKEQLEAKVQNHEADKRTLESFKQQLTDAASKLDKPLVFIIDELDRCKPEFSIRLIERIKHFFEIPNIVFVLAIHKKQLCESIDSYYGFKGENQYLEKFIDFSFKLSSGNNFEENSIKQIVSLIENLGLTKEGEEASEGRLFQMCNFLCKINRPTPRQLNSTLNKFSLLSNENKLGFKNDVLLICLFLKETGRESEIKDFKFFDKIVKEMIYWTGDLLQPDELKPNNISEQIRRRLSRDEFGFSPAIAPLLTAFAPVAQYKDDKARKEAQESAAFDFVPIRAGDAYKALDQAWLDYIQRGTL